MDRRPQPSPRPQARYWAACFLSLLWNVWGAYIALTAQSGHLPRLRAEDQAYFASQPLWFVVVADVALFAGIAGALALMVQHRAAVWLFTAALAILALTNVYDLAAGTSPILSHPERAVATLIVFAAIAAQISFAQRMAKRGLLH